MSDWTTQDWIAHFRTEHHDVKDRFWSGCPSGLDDGRLHQLVKEDPEETTI